MSAHSVVASVPAGSVDGQPRGRSLLLCTYEFPPLGGAQCTRLLHLCRELAERAWKIDVLTVRHSASHPRYDRTAVAGMPSAVRVFHSSPGPDYNRSLGRRPAEIIAGKPPPKGLRSTVFAVARALRAGVRATEWLPPALRMGHKLLRQSNYELILSAAAAIPFSAHTLAYCLKRLSKVPWVAEYGDPWTIDAGRHWPRCLRRLDTLLERTLLHTADGVVVTNETTRAAYLRHFPFLRPERVWTVLSGYNPEEYAAIPPITSAHFRLVYTGVVYPDIRSPGPFFAALAQLSDLEMEIVIAGSEFSSWRDTFCSCELHHVQFLGHVPRTQALGLQKGATVLLLIGNDAPFQLPLKTFEYIGARRPILCLRNGQNDLAAELLEPLRRAFVVDNKPECIALATRAAYAAWLRGELDAHFNLQDLQEYSWARQGAKLHTVLSNILEEQSNGASVDVSQCGKT